MKRTEEEIMQIISEYKDGAKEEAFSYADEIYDKYFGEFKYKEEEAS